MIEKYLKHIVNPWCDQGLPHLHGEHNYRLVHYVVYAKLCSRQIEVVMEENTGHPIYRSTPLGNSLMSTLIWYANHCIAMHYK